MMATLSGSVSFTTATKNYLHQHKKKTMQNYGSREEVEELC